MGLQMRSRFSASSRRTFFGSHQTSGYSAPKVPFFVLRVISSSIRPSRIYYFKNPPIWPQRKRSFSPAAACSSVLIRETVATAFKRSVQSGMNVDLLRINSIQEPICQAVTLDPEMPTNDSFSYRGVSAIRNGCRFAPYQAQYQTPLKPYASCLAIISFSQTFPLLRINMVCQSILTCNQPYNRSRTETLIPHSLQL
jgi:hypothetical protein